jgi:hypothetical protein
MDQHVMPTKKAITDVWAANLGIPNQCKEADRTAISLTQGFPGGRTVPQF